MSDHFLNLLDSQIESQQQLLREREQELETLRRNRDRLAELTAQRDELSAQLRTLEGEITGLERAMSSSLTKLGAKPEAAPPAAPAPAPESNGSKPAAPAPAADVKGPSLKDLVRKVLKASRQPLSGPDVAERVKAAGYQTTSKDFPNMVKSALTQMDEVEHVKGQGYRLKPGSR